MAPPRREQQVEPRPRELVVLVHGLGRTTRSLAPLRRSLERDGFATRSFGYASWRGRFQEHAQRLSRELAALDDDPEVARVHLVGHSLGNVLARCALLEARPRKLGRVVMLVPPNRGSRVARWLARWIGGVVPVLHQLSDDPSSDTCRLGRLDGVEIGVVSARFDHLVAESSARLDGETDHLRLATTHSLLMWRHDVQEAVACFLHSGRFVGAACPVPQPEREVR